MLITFSCPECKAELEVAATAGGSQVLCPQCSKTLTVPRKGPGPGVTIGQFQIQKLIGKSVMESAVCPLPSAVRPQRIPTSLCSCRLSRALTRDAINHSANTAGSTRPDTGPNSTAWHFDAK